MRPHSNARQRKQAGLLYRLAHHSAELRHIRLLTEVFRILNDKMRHVASFQFSLE
jgi:hypothetical protein